MTPLEKGVFDYRMDAPALRPLRRAPADAVLLFDGVFLMRPSVVQHWDLMIFVEASFDVALDRGRRRDSAKSETDESIAALYDRRYVPGQRLYLEACRPADPASVVIDNNDLENPAVRRLEVIRPHSSFPR